MHALQSPGLGAASCRTAPPRRTRLAAAGAWPSATAPPRSPTALAALAAPPAPIKEGPVQMLHGLGAVGDVPAKLMPFLLRLAHVR
jgi:hypothetical protein